MKAFSIARKTLRELWREPLLLGLLLFFPTLLVGFYYIAFGQTEEGLATYLNVLVVNQDTGVTTADGSTRQAGGDLVNEIRTEEYEDQPVFNVTLVTDPRPAEIALRERKASLLLVIPPNFSQTLAAADEPASPAIVSLIGDPNSESFIFARSMLEGLIHQFTTHAIGWEGEIPTITYEFLPGTGTMSDFEFGIGGIIVFGIMFAMITTATVLVRENVQHTLRRLRLTRARAADLLSGVTLSQMAIIVVQIFITFGAAVAMGFHSNGSLLLAMGLGLLLSLSAVGVGLIVACFARNDGEAANLSSVALVPLVFLSGALYPMPETNVATIGNRTIQIYDLLPTTHAAEAMRKVLVFGDGLNAIWYEVVMMTTLSAIIFMAGVVLHQRLQLRKI